MNRIRLLLLPLSWLYWLAVRIRNWLFDAGIAKSFEFDIPTICVGNLTVGGTGKTPHTDYLISLLKSEYKIALLSRGYGRKTKGFRIVEPTSTAGEVGDEPLQLKIKHPQVTCAVHEDRVNGVVELLAIQPELEALVLDDAFQHRWIRAGLNILMVDYNRPINKDFLLPAGNLRDSISEVKRANIVVVSKCPENISTDDQQRFISKINLNDTQQIYFTTYRYGVPKAIHNGSLELAPNPTKPVVALAGIANPGKFFNQVENQFNVLQKKAFADHHNFTVKEILSIFEATSKRMGKGFAVITTEKDAARIRTLPLSAEVMQKFYYLPLEVHFLNNEGNRFNRQILSYVRENKPNGNLHQE